jgi:hypothetical protein
MPGTPQTMWVQFVNALAAASGGKGIDPTQFLPASGLQIANWEYLDTSGLGLPTQPNTTPGSPNPSGMLAVADQMPTWAPEYNPSGLSFYNQYVAFLNSIYLKGGDPAQAQIASGLRPAVTAAQQQMNTDTMAAFTAWSAFNQGQASIPPANQLTYAQWYQTYQQPIISQDQAALLAAQTNYYKALQAQGGPDYATISQAVNQATPLQAGNTGYAPSGGGALAPMYTISPAGTTWYGGLNAWYQNALATAGRTVTPQPAPQLQFTIDLSNTNVSDLKQSQYYGGSSSASYSSFFWGGSAQASYYNSSDSHDFSQVVSNCKLTFSAMQITAFGPVVPGGWFNSAMVSDFYDQIDPNSALANKQLFGANGVLNMRAGLVFVAYRPSVTLTGSTSSIQQVTNAFQQQAQGSVSVGGFCWSASAGFGWGQSSLSQDLKVSTDGTQVTLTDNTNAPKILGIQPVRVGNVQ